jgi:uncharacterized cupin superfamily protein
VRSALNLLRVPPGRESFVADTHTADEEWIFVLAGRGLAPIGDEELEVGAGDFMGLKTPSVAHPLRNPFTEDLVYLCGGEIRSAEISDHPDHGVVLVHQPNAAHVVAKDALRKIQ